MAGYLVALAVPLLLVPVLVPLRGRLELASDALLYLLTVVTTSIIGGLGPALVDGLLSAALLNFFFTAPLHTFRIHDTTDVLAVVVFAVVAGMVSWVVDLAARRAAAARGASELDAANRLRTALLAAVGHDLRAPLAAAKAVVSGLRSSDVTVSETDRSELLETADGALDQLGGLIENLLDLSRLQAGALPVRTRAVALYDVLAAVLDDLAVRSSPTMVDVPPDLPDVLVDPGLLERVIVNIVTNAQRHTVTPPRITASLVADRIVLRVVDDGPGIAPGERVRVFTPFQRLGDTSPGGLGLGLALARGLAEAMAATLELRDTPGGGLTVALSLATDATPSHVPEAS